MECILFRHGIAIELENWSGEDRSRPLTAEGIEKTREAVRGLLHIGIRPSHILCSPFLRTQQTAAIAKDIFGFVEKPRLCKQLFSEAAPKDLLDLLVEFSQDDQILCIGHEPHLGLTAGVMLFGYPVMSLPFEKAGACSIQFKGKATPGNGVLQWLFPSAQLQQLRKMED